MMVFIYFILVSLFLIAISVLVLGGGLAWDKDFGKIMFFLMLSAVLVLVIGFVLMLSGVIQ